MKDMEEELLSCSLVDCVRKGIFYLDLYNKIKHCGHPNITICQTYDVGSQPYVILDVGDDCNTILFPKDYGKTWALTKEELQ